MKLSKLAKNAGSGYGGCPTVYLGEVGDFVVQGHMLDPATYSELKNVLPGETAVRISPQVVLDAVKRYGKPEG